MSRNAASAADASGGIGDVRVSPIVNPTQTLISAHIGELREVICEE